MDVGRHRQTPEDPVNIGRHWLTEAGIPSFLNPQYRGLLNHMPYWSPK